MVKCLEKPLLVDECPFGALADAIACHLWSSMFDLSLLWKNFDMTFALIYVHRASNRMSIAFGSFYQIELVLTLGCILWLREGVNAAL